MAERGRPSLYSEAVAAEICARLAEGEGLRSVCRGDSMPAPSTVIGWALENREGFSERYAKAKDVATHLMAEELLEIADDTSRDEIPVLDDSGNEVGTKANAEFINRSRLRVDTRKWLLSKLMAKKYGDKLDVTSAGEQIKSVFVMNLATRES